MKQLACLISFLCLSIHVFASEAMEEDFKERYLAAVESGDVSRENLASIWLYGDTPDTPNIPAVKGVETAHEHGVKSITFHEVFPKLRERYGKPFKVDGVEYVPNLEPYKLVEIKLEEKDENGRAGWASVVGIKEGKIYLAGLTKVETE